MALDERLRRELDEAGRPADPSGVYEELIRRHERRRGAKQLKAIALTVGVIAATVVGVVALSNVFEPSRTSPGDDPGPVPIGPFRNGRIAYSLSASGGMELHTILPDGSGDRVVPTPPGLPWLPAWSPDGSRLAVAIFPTGGGPRAIWVLDADGSKAMKVGSAGNVSVPSWSPDGSAIAYSATTSDRRTEIRLVSPDGSNERVIHSEGAEGTFAIFSAKFSPDGREILFDRGTDSGYDIFVMDVDGTNIRRLTTTGSDYDPHWSPDGSRIAFTREGDGRSDIYVMDADGTNVQQLTDGGEGVTNLYPNWAPDGTAIAYVAGGTGGPGLVVIKSDGSEPSTLVEGGVLGVSWQPLPADPIDPTPDPTPVPAGEDLGLGFPVCNITSMDDEFVAAGVNSTVFVATRRGDTGGCPLPQEAFNVVGLDEDGDGLVESSFGPIECEFECRTFSAPDIDGDGNDELLVHQGGGTVIALHLYDVTMDGGQPAIAPVNVAGLGPQGDFEPDDLAVFLLGGDAFELYSLRCGDISAPDGPGIVATSAESLPHDSPDAEWHAREVTLVLRDDGVMEVVDIRNFTEPDTDEGPSFRSGETLCGSNLGP